MCEEEIGKMEITVTVLVTYLMKGYLAPSHKMK
jgi:hypothetical protein